MLRFFFDTQDGEQTLLDEEGSEFSNFQSAHQAAICLLPNIARDVHRQDGNQHLVITVRDESNQPLFKATLLLTTEWLVHAPGHNIRGF